MIIKVKKLYKNSFLPLYAHKGEDAAFDLFASHKHTVPASGTLNIPIGIACEIPYGYWGHIIGKSSLASRGIVILGGVIDCGYRGEWHVQVFNAGKFIWNIQPGYKIAQCVILPCPKFEIVEAVDLSESQRMENGFGSTGR